MIYAVFTAGVILYFELLPSQCLLYSDKFGIQLYQLEERENILEKGFLICVKHTNVFYLCCEAPRRNDSFQDRVKVMK